MKNNLAIIKTRIENYENRPEKKQCLYINNYQIKVDSELKIYEYEISISPEIPHDSPTFNEIMKSLSDTISVKAFMTNSWLRYQSKIYLPISKNSIIQKFTFQIMKDS